MSIQTDLPVATIATEHPASVRVFQKLGIDFCCAGKLALSVACERKGLSPETVLTALMEADADVRTDDRDWSGATLDALIQHLVERHHTFTRDEIERLSPLASKVARVHGDGHPFLNEVQSLFQVLADELRPHMMKEELILFPYIRRLESGGTAAEACFPTVQNPIRMMEMEHDAAGDILKGLRQLTGDYALPEQACGSWRALYAGLLDFEADLHQHIHLENNVLFPRAIALERG